MTSLPTFLPCAALLLGTVAASVQAAEELPLWEAGLGVAAVSFPAYRGSDQRNCFVLPSPFFVYRGEFLKADRDGVRAELFDSERAELTLSVALSPPAASKDIRARAGMPDLRANFEIGPQLNLTLWQTDDRARQLKLLLPMRQGHKKLQPRLQQVHVLRLSHLHRGFLQPQLLLFQRF
jgi:hypothetical protein